MALRNLLVIVDYANMSKTIVCQTLSLVCFMFGEGGLINSGMKIPVLNRTRFVYYNENDLPRDILVDTVHRTNFCS